MKKYYLLAILLLAVSSAAVAQWDGNAATVNNPVGTSALNDNYVYTTQDGSGGIIAVWTAFDYINNVARIFAQRKTSNGAISWGTADTPKQLFSIDYSTIYDVSLVDVKADGAGGAYISWSVTVNDTIANVYLQRISSTGTALFAAGGLRVTPASNHYYGDGKFCVDAAGIIISWSDQVYNGATNFPTSAQIIAQRYNPSGVAQWGANGVLVSAAAGLRAVSQIISDGSNGAFIAFTDTRNAIIDADGNTDNADIYAQHISNTGARLWGAADAAVSTAAYNQYTLEGGGSFVFNSMIADSAGGFMMVYEDYRSNNDSAAKLYAQRLNGNGTRLWAADGVALETGAGYAEYVDLIMVANDGANGMVAGWDRNSYISGLQSNSLKAQRITAAGVRSWGNAGSTITPAGTDILYNTTMAADGAGAYVACWSAPDANFNTVIKAQKINGAGAAQWAAAGVDICTNPLAQPSNNVLSKSNAGSMIVTWMDQRNYTQNQNDIYAAKITSTGSLVNSNVVSYISTANGTWNNPATWIGNVVPPAGVDVIVRHNVTGNVNAVCNTLTVQAPGSLTVNSGINITVQH